MSTENSFYSFIMLLSEDAELDKGVIHQLHILLDDLSSSGDIRSFDNSIREIFDCDDFLLEYIHRLIRHTYGQIYLIKTGSA